MSSPSNSQEDVNALNLKPRGRRGNTCFNCRRRRIRCDGGQPICTNCSRGGTQFDDCEYPSTSRPSQVAILEDRIATVRDRIRVLEDPNQSEHVALHHPYVGPIHLTDPSNEGVDSVPSSNSPSPSPEFGLSKDEWDVYFRAFSENAHQFGFFVKPERLWQRTMLDELSDEHANILCALREAISLWNTRLSAPDPVIEETLLQKVLDGLSSEIPGRYQCKAIQIVQAEILVGYYFLHDGKVLQAAHHADAAFSLALASGLHQIRLPSFAGSDRELTSTLALQELNEKGQAFWEAVILNGHCATSLGLQAPLHRVQLMDITTPWPTDPGRPQATSAPVAERPLHAFLQGISTSGYSIMALYTKALILLERVMTSQKTTGRDGSLSWTEVNRLEEIIEELAGDLVLIQSSPDSHTPGWLTLKRSITALLIHATKIRLHIPHLDSVPESRVKCLEAANEIGQAMLSLNGEFGEPQRVDPALGAIWSAACEVLVCELVAGRLVNSQRVTGVSSLTAIFEVWTDFSSNNGLLHTSFTKCEEGLGVKIRDVLEVAKV